VNRLQKKWFIASATMHSMLLALLLFSPAFMSSQKKVETIPVITFIPGKLIDEQMLGGGSPNASSPPRSETTPPLSPPQAQPPPEPEPPRIERNVQPPKAAEAELLPVKSSKKADAEPVPVNTKKNTKQTPPAKSPATETPPNQKTQKKRPEIKIPDSDKSFDTKKDADAKARAKAEAKRRADYAATLREVSENLGKNLSTGTAIEPLGPGGEAYAYYGWIVVKYFEDAWNPSDVAESDGSVKVTVTIRRDGTVHSFEITQRSGSSALDKSVQRAMERVKSVPAFPEGATEERRSFKLNFNLKAKRLSG
jgi:TonB family protein